MSGTINLQRKSPKFENFVDFSASYGHFQTFRNTVDLGLTDASKSISFRLNGLWQKSNNYRIDKKSRVYAVNPAMTWRASKRSTVSLNLEYAQNEFKPDTGLPLQLDPIQQQFTALPNISRKTSFQTPFDDSNQSIYRAKLGYQWNATRDLIVRNSLYYVDLNWLAKGTLLNGAFPVSADSIIVSRSMSTIDDRQKTIGNQLEAVYYKQTGYLRHELMAGFEFAEFSDLFTYNIIPQLPALALNNPIETAQASDLVEIPFEKGDTKRSILAPYFVDKITLHKSVQVFLGGRFDMISFHDQLSATRRRYNKFSPMAGMVFTPSDQVSIYTNAGQAFAPPSARVVGERNPEQSQQIEIGLKYKTFDGKTHSSIALYRLSKDNIAIPDATGFLQQTGSQESRGVEFDLQIEMPNDWRSIVNYAYNESELTRYFQRVQLGVDESYRPIYMFFDRSGNYEAFAPKHLFNLWCSKELTHNIEINVGWSFSSSQYIHENNNFKIGGYHILSGSLSYQTGLWIFFLNCQNITNTQYEIRGFSDSSIIPGDPLRINGGVKVKLF